MLMQRARLFKKNLKRLLKTGKSTLLLHINLTQKTKIIIIFFLLIKPMARTMIFYKIKLEYLGGFGDNFTAKAMWNRILLISEKYTLEQLNDAIIQILCWDNIHLYKFIIYKKLYYYFGISKNNILDYNLEESSYSCDIQISQLNLGLEMEFEYIYDFGDEQRFSLEIIDIIKSDVKLKPHLIAFNGNNILQYPSFDIEKDNYLKLTDSEPPQNLLSEITIDTRFYKLHEWEVRFIQAKDFDKLVKLRKSHDKRKWAKAVVILDSKKGGPKYLAEKIEVFPNRVKNWIKIYNASGLDKLLEPRRQNKPKIEKRIQLRANRILEIFHQPPNTFGINRSNWTISALNEIYVKKYNDKISISTTGQLLRKISGYSRKKTRQRLTSSDPDYREKVDLLLKVLHSLKENEELFFIDEVGPMQVKKYGGRTYFHKNYIRKIPVNAKSKGSIIFSAALSAKSNQISWMFNKSKNSEAMIKLIEMIYNQYNKLSKIYITWDAASWHNSEELITWLDEFNRKTNVLRIGPIIEFIPLPSCAQFLDIIESVFSIMKRTIIHLSNYQSVNQMKTAISLHFQERNDFFKKNPKRAGNKIWSLDFFDDNENIRHGNYREW